MSGKQHSGGFNEDALLEYVIRIRRFFIKNKSTIIAVTFLALALIVFFVVRAIETQKAEAEASTAFERVSLMLRSNAQERIGDIETQLSDIIKKWPNTLGAARASFHLGHLQYNLENYAAALENYRRASRYSSSIYLHPAALQGIANIHEQTGDLDRAVEYYSRIEASPRHFGYRNIALLGKARCLGMKGDIREARRLLQIVLTERCPLTGQFSPLAGEAEQILVWLDGLQETLDLPGN
jgi:predicted negative regulator of RcsB-dependent stress response